MNKQEQIVSIAKNVFQIEAESILDLIQRVDSSFVEAVELILGVSGKVVVTGTVTRPTLSLSIIFAKTFQNS
jgi:arabinose-5-phosphate isomerase